MEVTKREILFSSIIIAIMIGLGVLISNPIISSATNKALEISSAVQVKDSSKFDYIQRTDVGKFIAEGTLSVIDSVSIPDIQGYYSKIEKVKEKYTAHTRTVTTTDSEGHTHTHTETYWEWDRVDSWEWESKYMKFLGKTFAPKQIKYRYYTQYKETIKPKVKWYESKIRYKYYTSPTTDYGVLEGNVENKSYNRLIFKSNTNIEKTVKSAQDNIKSAPVLFWILWILLTGGLVFLFYYAENKWLYDYKEKKY